MAERVRFELTAPCEATVFKTAAFGHSATSPTTNLLSNKKLTIQIIQDKEWCCVDSLFHSFDPPLLGIPILVFYTIIPRPQAYSYLFIKRLSNTVLLHKAPMLSSTYAEPGFTPAHLDFLVLFDACGHLFPSPVFQLPLSWWRFILGQIQWIGL